MEVNWAWEKEMIESRDDDIKVMLGYHKQSGQKGIIIRADDLVHRQDTYGS